jgi:hypothetical protein
MNAGERRPGWHSALHGEADSEAKAEAEAGVLSTSAGRFQRRFPFDLCFASLCVVYFSLLFSLRSLHRDGDEFSTLPLEASDAAGGTGEDVAFLRVGRQEFEFAGRTRCRAGPLQVPLTASASTGAVRL